MGSSLVVQRCAEICPKFIPDLARAMRDRQLLIATSGRCLPLLVAAGCCLRLLAGGATTALALLLLCSPLRQPSSVKESAEGVTSTAAQEAGVTDGAMQAGGPWRWRCAAV